MKISNFVLSLAFASLCLNQASGQGVSYPPNSAASRSIGDSTAASRPAEFNAARSLSDRSVDFAAAENDSGLAQDGVSSYQASYAPQGSVDSGNASSPAAGSPAAGSYTSESYFGGCGMNRNPQVWFNSETLLWFTESVSSPALVNTSGYAVLPITGDPGVQTVFGGGDGIDYGLTPGFRFSGGMYLGDEQKVGIGGRGYGLFNPRESY